MAAPSIPPPFIDPAVRIGRVPEITIAASNSSAYAKSRADYVCTGVNDNVLIQSVINALPVVADFTRSAVRMIGGRAGNIRLLEGIFNFANTLTFPAGGTFGFCGSGLNSWRVNDPSLNQWEGGTLIYSTAPTGLIIDLPFYTGPRVDTGVSNTIPGTSLNMSGIDFRVFNPATTQSNAAINLSGFQAGTVEYLNVSADNSVNTINRISSGITLDAGSRTSHKTLRNISVSNFRDAGFIFNTTHLFCDRLCSEGIEGGSSSTGFQFNPDQDCHYNSLHTFGNPYGIKSTGTKPLFIDSIMFESSGTPVLIQGAGSVVYIGTCIVNTDVNWTGDLASKCIIERVIKNGSPTIQGRNRGVATIVAGQTTITLAHSLIAIPRSASANAAIPVAVGVTYDATNLTLTISAVQATDTVVNWSAQAA